MAAACTIRDELLDEHSTNRRALVVDKLTVTTPPLSRQETNRAARRGGLYVVLACTTALALCALLLASCGSGGEAEADPEALYRAALRPEAEGVLEALGDAPRYEITVEIDDALENLLGTATVHVPNSSQDPWSTLLFRLYPVINHYGGTMTLQSVTVDGQPTNFVYAAETTAVEVLLAQPLLPGRSVSVGLSWKLTIPRWSDSPSMYVLFGTSQQMTSLPLFYPSLAVYVPGPAPGSGRWWQEIGSVRGDASFNYASLFVVTATLPSAQVPVATGTLITSTAVDGGRTRHVWATGPAREFLLHSSSQFESASVEAYGTRVTSYWLPGKEGAGRSVLKHAAAALRIYSDRFGAYPYRDMAVAVAPISYRGMEYPQVSLLGTELYGNSRANLEIVAVHEVAHQWWYNMVHNDPVNTPWLDEALAEYSVRLYMEDLRGTGAGESLLVSRWQTPLNVLREQDQETAINQPVTEFASGNQYETVVYGKGALYYDAMRDEMGERAFNKYLRNFLADHKWDIFDVDDWLADLQALKRPTLQERYREWFIPQPGQALPEEAAETGLAT